MKNNMVKFSAKIVILDDDDNRLVIAESIPMLIDKKNVVKRNNFNSIIKCIHGKEYNDYILDSVLDMHRMYDLLDYDNCPNLKIESYIDDELFLVDDCVDCYYNL